MARNFPNWNDTHWDYEKGNLNDPTKRYAVEAGRRVKAAGGVVHYFAVGQVFEQADVGWLKQLVADGHPIGNHTYDHINVLAKRHEDVQFRFARAPWLVENRTVEQVIVDNIRLASTAMKSRLGISPAGFRTPGGFANGLTDRPDVRRWLLDLGVRWVSGLYPAHVVAKPGVRPNVEYVQQLLVTQRNTRPFVYPDGLIEVPMNPISDIVAFRGGRWKLEWFLETIRTLVEATIEAGGTFDFLCHPSCLYVVDPQFKTIDLILELVNQAKDRAAIVGLDAFADLARKPTT